MIEIARALCAQPRLLLLDEPAAGLSLHEIERLRTILQAAARAGATVLLVEHNLRFVRAVADVAHVLHFGALVASGPAVTIAEEPAVRKVLPGVHQRRRRAAIAVRRSATSCSTSATRTRGTTASASSETCPLPLPRGTVEVLLGRNGAGKSTLLAAIAGQVALSAGVIVVDGVDVGRLPAHRRAAAGIAFVPEGKRIFRARTVGENVAIGTFSLRLSRRERARLCAEVLAQFPGLQEREADRAGDLSGGQQQMLAIGQAVAARPKLLLLDEPSAGLASAVMSDVFQSIRQLSDDGLTTLLVEHRVSEAVGIADHVTVLDDGRVVSAGTPEHYAEAQVHDPV